MMADSLTLASCFFYFTGLNHVLSKVDFAVRTAVDAVGQQSRKLGSKAERTVRQLNSAMVLHPPLSLFVFFHRFPNFCGKRKLHGNWALK